MCDLLLVRSNDQKAVYGDTQSYVACEPPYWGGVIAAYCREREIVVQILDVEALNLTPEDAAREIKRINPSIVGLIVTGTNLSASTQKMQGAGLQARAIKDISDVPVFMWGLHPSSLPERTLKEEAIDYVIGGEGLDTIVDLTKLIRMGMSPVGKDIDGLNYKNMDGSIHLNSHLRIIPAKNIPSPAWDLMPMDRYLPHNWQLMGAKKEEARGKYAVLATSLGCPFSCTFCAISSLFGAKQVRFIDVDQVVADIDLLVNKYHIKYIKMQDECFVLNPEYIDELCDKLIERNYDLNIWGYARVDTVKKSMLKKLKQAGIKWLAFGVESGSTKSLNGVAKGQFDNEKVKKVMKMTQETGIHILIDIMFGLPDDDKEAMAASLNLCKEINPEWINFYSTMPYPGSQLYNEYLERGESLPDSWIAYAQYSYECTPKGSKYLTPAQVLKYRDYAFNAFFNDNTKYFELIKDEFGESAVNEIKNMTKNKLRRRLLGD